MKGTFSLNGTTFVLTILQSPYGEIIAKDYISAFIEFFFIKINLKVKFLAKYMIDETILHIPLGVKPLIHQSGLCSIVKTKSSPI
jgi:hypothetical protein